VLLLSACGAGDGGASSAQVTLNVPAAASLTDAFKKIGDQFHAAHPNVTVTFNFGGSDMLATQIVQGAPADVFASANTKQMDVVVKGGQVAGASVKTFAHNRLVVIVPSANPAKIQTLQDLAKPGVKVVLAARAVPVGQYALDFLTKANADPAFGASYKDACSRTSSPTSRT
jgi:molybdate transport system substrate-binding protein